MPQHNFESPRLLADIGGTYARFALESRAGVSSSTRPRCAAPTTPTSMPRSRPTWPACRRSPRSGHAAVAIANPVAGDQVRMTNYHWQFSIEEMRERLRFDNLVVVNDFTALAMACPACCRISGARSAAARRCARSVIGLIGAGSGLGVSGLIPAGRRLGRAGHRRRPHQLLAARRARDRTSCNTPGGSSRTCPSNACCRARASS